MSLTGLASLPPRTSGIPGYRGAPASVTSDETVNMAIGGSFRRSEWLSPEHGGTNADLSPETAEQLSRLASLVDHTREQFRSVDRAVAALHRNENLSELGRARESKKIAVANLKEVDSGVKVQAAAHFVQDRMKELRGTLEQVLEPPKTMHDALLAASIRDHIGRLGSDKPMWLHAHAGDRHVVMTVMNAPGFLFNLSEDERAAYLKTAQQAMYPAESRELKLLQTAWQESRKAVDTAARMIQNRARLRRARDGESWLTEGEEDTTRAARLTPEKVEVKAPEPEPENPAPVLMDA